MVPRFQERDPSVAFIHELVLRSYASDGWSRVEDGPLVDPLAWGVGVEDAYQEHGAFFGRVPVLERVACWGGCGFPSWRHNLMAAARLWYAVMSARFLVGVSSGRCILRRLRLTTKDAAATVTPRGAIFPRRTSSMRWDILHMGVPSTLWCIRMVVVVSRRGGSCPRVRSGRSGGLSPLADCRLVAGWMVMAGHPHGGVSLWRHIPMAAVGGPSRGEPWWIRWRRAASLGRTRKQQHCWTYLLLPGWSLCMKPFLKNELSAPSRLCSDCTTFPEGSVYG